MKIIIIGAGFTGIELAHKLVTEKWDVILVDKNPAHVREASSQLDCTVVSSEGNSLEVLESSGVASADALVAVTEDDETNMMTCALVEAVHPNVLTIARVRNEAYYSKLLDRARGMDGQAAPRRLFGVDRMIRPVIEVSDAIIRSVTSGAVGDLLALGEDWIVLCLTIGEDSPLAGFPLWRLSTVEGWKYLVVYVISDERTLLPDGSTELHVGDRVGILLRRADAESLCELAHVQTEKSTRVIVYGAGRIGGRVVDNLRESSSRSLIAALFHRSDADRRDLVLVDPDPERCRVCSDAFRDVCVVCGELTDESVVDEERLDTCDLVVAASENFDRNLIVAAYMKSRGVRRTIALIENDDIAGIARQLGVDVAISMRETVVDNVMGCLRGAHVSSVHTVCGGACEIVTCTVGKKSRAAGKSLKDIARAGEYLVLLVRPLDGGAAFVPRGDTMLSQGSTVVIIARDGRKSARIFAD